MGASQAQRLEIDDKENESISKCQTLELQPKKLFKAPKPQGQDLSGGVLGISNVPSEKIPVILKAKLKGSSWSVLQNLDQSKASSQSNVDNKRTMGQKAGRSRDTTRRIEGALKKSKSNSAPPACTSKPFLSTLAMPNTTAVLGWQ